MLLVTVICLFITDFVKAGEEKSIDVYIYKK
jgi:hypothetical protein